MNIAVILAGGHGNRTGQDVPKQFLNVYEKPLIIYTLENFEKHPEIDVIEVVCLKGWHEVLRAYAKQYHITKLRWIVSGGENGQESTKIGVQTLEPYCKSDDVVLIHDAIRPFLLPEIITDAIVKCRQRGSGLSAVRCQETIVRTNDGIVGEESIDRKEVMRVQTPQAYRFEKLVWAFEEAQRRNIQDEVYVNTLMLHLGEKVYFSLGSEKNIKITTVDDLELFKSLLHMKREDWMK